MPDYNSSYTGVQIDEAVGLARGNLPGLNITGATVGQYAKVKTVDGSGAPTAWEAGTPSGGGGAPVKLYSLSLTEEVASIVTQAYTGYMNYKVFAYRPAPENYSCSVLYIMPDVDIFNPKPFLDSYPGDGKDLNLVATLHWFDSTTATLEYAEFAGTSTANNLKSLPKMTPRNIGGTAACGSIKVSWSSALGINLPVGTKLEIWGWN